ncbi:MAG: EAL domain-containing protein [Gammaproteobacteria bacterium]|nr:EAL domain-containing protein [Gammaproteobacteria bacterium]
MTILIIDQNTSDQQQMLKAFSLQDSSPTLIAKSSITEALGHIQSSIPDIIISDYYLPDGDVTILLSNSLVSKKIPVIILTAKGNEKLAVEVLKNGAIDYLAKTAEAYISLPRTIKRNHREWLSLKQKEQIKKDLVISEARLAEAQNIAQMGNWEWNLATDAVYCSNEIFTILGTDKTEFINGFDDILRFVHQHDHQMLKQAINNVIKSKMPFVLEFTIIQQHGKEITVKSQGKAITNHQGETTHISGILQDITHSNETFKQLHLLAAALEASVDSIIITDINGKVVWANPAMSRLSGYKYTELINQTPHLWNSLNQDKSLFDNLWKTILAGEVWESELINCKKSGEQYLEEQTITSVLNERGEISHFVSIKRDITKRKESEAKNLQAAHVFEHSIEGILICDSLNTIIRVNPAFTKITGYNEHDIIGKKPNILKSGNHEDCFYQDMWQQINTSGVWQGEIWNRRKNGEIYPELLTISTLKDNADNIIEYIAIFADITERKQDAEQIRKLAFYDTLTNLPNRVLSHEILKNTLSLRESDSELIGILNIDIDRFFNINETMGHDAGDKLLQIIARRIIRCNNEIDKIARISSDEFIVICPDISAPGQLAKKAQEILDSIAKPIMLNKHEVFITASIGISIAPTDSDNEAMLFRHAESARKHAKHDGNSFQFFNDEVDTQGFEQLAMKSSLRRALERNEFKLYYQPQIDLRSGKILGAESLIRWLHPDLGLISPSKFIPILEETGLIIEVGEWVIKTACQQNKEWQSKGISPIQIAVNLSPRQFRQNTLISDIQKILDETGLQARWLELEVTESSIMDKPEEVAKTLQNLHKLGIKISIDDFGTGYSSLNYLKIFPIDILKIDRSFIRDITFDKDDETIVKTIIAMGHNLGLKIIAEGVEDQEQLEILKQYDCELYQGFYCSKPVAAEDFEQLLIDNHRSLKRTITAADKT